LFILQGLTSRLGRFGSR